MMMDIHRLVLWLMAFQGCLGAFDTIYHHELTEALPRRATARLELCIHSVRASIYCLLFVGLSSFDWNGAWAWILIALFAVEIILTLWDFVVEDRTRLLPATERVTHTVLAINGGAFVALLILTALAHAGEPSGLVWNPQGWLGVFLALCGIGVGLSALRDAYAAIGIVRRPQAEIVLQPDAFGPAKLRVLVTGGTGFIGTALIHALTADGHEADVLTRNPRRAAWLFDGTVRCWEDLRDIPPSWTFDVIVNLAGSRILGLPWSPRRRKQLLASRVGTTDDLVQWIARASHKPQLLISASAIGYYGVQPETSDAVLDELSPPQSIFMSELCQQWEKSAFKAADLGVAVVITRFGLVLGNGGALPMLLLPIRLGLGGRLGSGRQVISWIHLHDVIAAIAHACASVRANQIYNLTAPTPVTQAEFSRTAARVLKRPCFFRTPAWPLRFALGEQSTLLLDGQRVEPVRLHQEGFTFRYTVLDDALADLC